MSPVRRRTGGDRLLGWASALAVVGVLLFAATLVLALKGGPDAGDMLGRLNNFFPYYSVDVQGAFLGALYAFILGQIVGRVVCAVYNRTARS